MKVSRVGKQPVLLPPGTTAQISGRKIVVAGKLGSEEVEFTNNVKVSIKEDKIIVEPAHNSRTAKAEHGLFRMLIANAVKGVNEGFTKKLEVIGIGFKVSLQGKDLQLALGYSHPIIFPAPEGISFQVNKNIISVFGTNKARVGSVAAEIRKLRPPEPYKGKGIRYLGEQIRRKAGKAAKVVGAK